LTTALSGSSTQKHSGTDALPKKFVCANYQNCIFKYFLLKIRNRSGEKPEKHEIKKSNRLNLKNKSFEK
jgi:hypothetical protein